jgi:spermidine/putrescine transport system ATP-binding protein
MMIKTVNLQKIFKTEEVETWALNNVSLEIKEGEFVAIMGPSGCGKSTLLNILGLLDNPSGGEYYLNGTDVSKFTEAQRTNLRKGVIGFVFQSFNLIDELNVYENIELPLLYMGIPASERKKRVEEAMNRMAIAHRVKHFPQQLSGGQQQRVAIARAIVNEPEVLLLDEPLAALDLKMRKDMQMELKEMHKSLGITFVYVTHDQEEALTLSDTIVVMSEGKIQQIGTPIDIYNEPINAFVADFIGESNILNGTMIHDKLVRFCGTEFECVDEGFGENVPVDVVIRPEDLYIFPVSDMAQLVGVVETSIFKGVHYEMTVMCGGYEFLVQDYHHFEVGAEVGLVVKPFDIHIMKKERICNTFEGKLLDATHVEFLGCNFECTPVEDIAADTNVKVEIDFEKVILQDNEEDGTLTGEVKFILYKGDHYHLTVLSDWDENVFVDTNDVWDDGDRVGITIPPDAIRIIKITD